MRPFGSPRRPVGPSNSPAYIHGEVYETTGKDAHKRVKITGGAAFIGAVSGVGKTQKLDESWTVKDDPEIKRRADEKKAREDARKAEQDKEQNEFDRKSPQSSFRSAANAAAGLGTDSRSGGFGVGPALPQDSRGAR